MINIPTPNNYSITIGDLQTAAKSFDFSQFDKVVILTDQNVATHCLPYAVKALDLGQLPTITIPAGEANKSFETIQQVWKEMSDMGMSRLSLLIALGGGVVGDLGGFAAFCYQRGIPFVQIPTSLMAMTDSSVGGKTGVNLGSLKNMIGAFHFPSAVFIDTHFLDTLPQVEWQCGRAEMLKHALIAHPEAFIPTLAFESLKSEAELALLHQSLMVKVNIVAKDPFEEGLRKSLNFGHTAGHAFESLALEHALPIPTHGHAVAWGMQVALVLSVSMLNYPIAKAKAQMDALEAMYGKPLLPIALQASFCERLLKDKKNYNDDVRFCLLLQPGQAVWNKIVQIEQVLACVTWV